MPCGDLKIFSGICPTPTVAVYRCCHLSLPVPAVIDMLYKILPLLFRHAAAVFLSKEDLHFHNVLLSHNSPCLKEALCRASSRLDICAVIQVST